jgi:hypothetical protein
MYPDEMAEIAKQKFKNLKAMPCPQNLDFHPSGSKL